MAALLLVGTLRAFLLPQEELLDACLFGSQARGTAQPHSDVNIAVYVDAARPPPAPCG